MGAPSSRYTQGLGAGAVHPGCRPAPHAGARLPATTQQLADASARTMAACHVHTADETDPTAYPYYGFYDVTLFDCPPFVMFTANDCPRALNILHQRSFEPQSMALWCKLARQATAILDVGAHVGVYSLAAASLRPDLPVHAFEPNPYAAARLRMHKQINGFANIIEYPMAVAARTERAAFGWHDKGNGQISSGGALGVPGITVHTGTLDRIEYIGTGDRALMKIDVEGGEGAVFAGAEKFMAEHRPDVILECFSEKNAAAIWEQLKPLDYRVWAIREAGGYEEWCTLTARSSKGQDFNVFLSTRNLP